MSEEIDYEDKSLVEYQNELRKLIDKSGDLFEKQFIYVSSGLLVSSFFIVEKLFTEFSKTQHKYFIVFSWIFVGLGIVLNMISHRYSQRMLSQNLNDINNKNYDQPKAETRNRNVGYVNDGCVALFFIGLTFFILYVSINLLT